MSTECKADFDSVPIVDVTSENVKQLEPAIRIAISTSDFVAIDCELSGLGDRKKLNATSVEDRYDYAGLAAKTRAIISLGLATFRLTKRGDTDSNRVNYQVQTYNLMALCGEDYIVEPASLKFLVDHGFDFNKQYSKGIKYYRGDDKESDDESPLRRIFSEVVRQRKPLVLHNGFIDLVFLYQNFYAQLPVSLDAFVADLSEMFPSGIFDTKFVADFVCRTTSSFLEFVFKTLQKRNVKRSEAGVLHLAISFPSYPENCDYLDIRKCAHTRASQFVDSDDVEICESYANHGHCDGGKFCSKSHNIDRIVLQKGGLKRRKTDSPKTSSTRKKSLESDSVTLEQNGDVSAGHRAGFDAFMTGFSFLVFLTHRNESVGEKKSSNFLDGHQVQEEVCEDKIVNRIYLMSKDFPLLIQRSNFSKNSFSHATKIMKLTNQESTASLESFK